MSFPQSEHVFIEDDEERALVLATQLKTDIIDALVAAAKARKARGGDATEIADALDHEDLTRAGYQRALDKRRRELAAVSSAPKKASR